MTKLRKFIMKTLLSYTKAPSHAGTKSSELGNETVVPMEASNIQQKEPAMREVEGRSEEIGAGGGGDGVKGGGGEDGGRGEGEAGGDSEIEMDAALELVDQMDIEISDGEGEPSPSVVTTEEGEREREREREREGRGGGKVGPAKEVGRGEGGKKARSRRRHSSVLSAVEFPTISLEKQLSDQQAVELMNLLHVCCGLKVSGPLTSAHVHTCI